MKTVIGVMVPVKSSTIQAIGWNGDCLYVRFISGGTYSYDGVLLGEYVNFMEAQSKGEFFETFIKGTYVFKKMEPGFELSKRLNMVAAMQSLECDAILAW